MLANANDRMRACEHQTNLMGQRLRQVTEIHEVSMAEVQAELEELEASSSPRFNKINTPDFGADALKAALNGQPTPMH
eukprot:2353763-Amphidinium_carterae.1